MYILVGITQYFCLPVGEPSEPPVVFWALGVMSLIYLSPSSRVQVVSKILENLISDPSCKSESVTE